MTFMVGKEGKNMNEINFFSLSTESLMTDAVPWFPDDTQSKKPSIPGPVLKLCAQPPLPPEKWGRTEKKGWEELI